MYNITSCRSPTSPHNCPIYPATMRYVPHTHHSSLFFEILNLNAPPALGRFPFLPQFGELTMARTVCCFTASSSLMDNARNYPNSGSAANLVKRTITRASNELECTAIRRINTNCYIIRHISDRNSYYHRWIKYCHSVPSLSQERSLRTVGSLPFSWLVQFHTIQCFIVNQF